MTCHVTNNLWLLSLRQSQTRLGGSDYNLSLDGSNPPAEVLQHDPSGKEPRESVAQCSTSGSQQADQRQANLHTKQRASQEVLGTGERERGEREKGRGFHSW